LPSTIERVHREFKSQGLVVLAIDIKENPDRVAGWTKAQGLTVPVLLDRDGAVAGAYAITATPTVFLIGRDGKLVASGKGQRPWDGEHGRALFKALLAARPR
jgi:peroxiredoxin